MAEATVYVIDDDEAVRDSLAFMLDCAGLNVRTFSSAGAFLEGMSDLEPGCIVTDVRMPEISGIELLHRLKAAGARHRTIVITGHGDVQLAVEAMKAGAADFLEKPFEEDQLLRSIKAAIAEGVTLLEADTERRRLAGLFESLSPRERDVLQGVVEGKLNKTIAFELGISARTVEVYRANMMAKTGAKGLSDLVRMALFAQR